MIGNLVNKISLYILTSFTLFPLIGCQEPTIKSIVFDNKSYITNFDLVQQNSTNDIRVKINSPQAIIDPTNNDIEIIDSSIEIIKLNGPDIKVLSGKSTLNNSNNLIRVYDKVKISMLGKNKSFITTNTFDWYLNKSNIILNSPLYINFNNTKISSSNGFYNIDSGQLKIINNIFNRNILNKEGKPIYKIEIISDTAKWLKVNNSLEFTSTDKQVETTVNILSIQ